MRASLFEKRQQRLIEIILAKTFLYSENPSFKLVCGEISQFYFNCKPTMLNAEGKLLLGLLGFEKLRRLGISAAGGLELGSVPFSGAISLISRLRGEPINDFIVRKTTKDHGVIAKIEGDSLKPGNRVAVLDDVITTGGSTIRAIDACESVGLIVVKVLVLVDRQEMNGRENILERVSNVEALLTKDQVMEAYSAQNSNLT